MPISILIVDDHPAIRHILTLILTSEGYTVNEAASGDDALARWHVLHPDLLILDLNLPGIPGWEVCQQVKALATTPIILMTGDTTIDLDIRQHVPAADGFLLKPFAMTEVLACVAAVLTPQLPMVMEAESGWCQETLHAGSASGLICQMGG